jgi:hypothetical protein
MIVAEVLMPHHWWPFQATHAGTCLLSHSSDARHSIFPLATYVSIGPPLNLPPISLSSSNTSHAIFCSCSSTPGSSLYVFTPSSPVVAWNKITILKDKGGPGLKNRT